jgi:glycosyltransferase involved in cell wall biosynthesis
VHGPTLDDENTLIGRWAFEAPRPASPVSPGKVPTFSVIIPAYQASGFIAGAMRSVLEQTVPPLEVIVCDDGSTDDLDTALEPYLGEIVLLRKENGGEASARNAAVAAATGDFVAMLDADDRFCSERLAAFGALAAARPDLDILCSDLVLEVRGAERGRFHQDTPFAVEDQRTAILERCFCPVPAIRRSRLLAVDGYDESLRTGSDWDCLVRLILTGSAVGVIKEPLYRYRLHDASLTADRLRALRERVRFLEKTAARPGLEPPEIAALTRSLDVQRRSLLLAEAESSLRMRRSDARRRALGVARARGLGFWVRCEALVSVLAPGIAARVLERRAQTTGSYLDRPIERGRKAQG